MLGKGTWPRVCGWVGLTWGCGWDGVLCAVPPAGDPGNPPSFTSSTSCGSGKSCAPGFGELGQGFWWGGLAAWGASEGLGGPAVVVSLLPQCLRCGICGFVPQSSWDAGSFPVSGSRQFEAGFPRGFRGAVGACAAQKPGAAERWTCWRAWVRPVYPSALLARGKTEARRTLGDPAFSLDPEGQPLVGPHSGAGVVLFHFARPRTWHAVESVGVMSRKRIV